MRFFIVFITLFLMVSAKAEPVSQSTVDAQAVITKQIEAFLNDDGPTAYSFAAPRIKSFFPSIEHFMSMVRDRYRPVYRPSTFDFDETTSTENKIVQRVLITGQDGKNYAALYFLDLQPDGMWKISSVILERVPGKNI